MIRDNSLEPVPHDSDPGAGEGTAWQIEAFFDGACPVCRREMAWLRRWDRHCRIRFTDIAAADFRAGEYGVTRDEFMTQIHARLPDGSWVRGVEVFRRLYTAVGWGPIVWLTRLPIVSSLLDVAYRVFARNRTRWTGRCLPGGDCRMAKPDTAVESVD
jgi:predicted DCC family thiol-disulfide oxidoreductase YuxK